MRSRREILQDLRSDIDVNGFQHFKTEDLLYSILEVLFDIRDQGVGHSEARYDSTGKFLGKF